MKDYDDFFDYTGNNKNHIYIDSYDEPIIENYLGQGNDIQYFNGYLYLFNGNSNAFLDDTDKGYGTTLLKYNVRTGTVTSVCQDPLCFHTTPDCPFSGRISKFYVNNSNIYYTRAYRYYSSKIKSPEFLRQFSTYNIETMKYNIHREEEIVDGTTYAEGNKQLFVDNYCYFYDYVYDEESEKYIFKICRMDLKTNKISVLGGENNFDNVSIENDYSFILDERFLFILNGRIYFTDIETIYSTDLDMNDKNIHINGNFIYDNIYTDGNYIYYGAITDTPNIQSLYRINFDGTEEINLEIYTGNWIITKNYIYYESIYNKTVGGKSENEGITFYSDAIFRCDHDGNNKEKVYQANNESTYIQLLSPCIVGNYIYANYYTYEDKNNNTKVDDGEYYYNANDINYNFMRIDMINSTVEYIYTN